MVEPNFGQQPLKTEATFGGAAALALILVDYQNAISGPTASNGALHQGILRLGGFAVLDHLVNGRLPDVDNRQPVEVPGLNFGRTWDGEWVSGHDAPPLRARV